jgi:hypothetical protein
MCADLLRPLQRESHEIFVLVHTIAFSGFLFATCFHALPKGKTRDWYRCPRSRRPLSMVIVYQHHALLSPREETGNPTQFLGLQRLVYPFIISIPSHGKLEFLFRAQAAGTIRFFRFASRDQGLLDAIEGVAPANQRVVVVEGPYGTMRSLRQFDSVIFARGVGCRFTTPSLQELVEVWKAEGQRSVWVQDFAHIPCRRTVTRRIRFIWVVKSRVQFGWVETQLRSVLKDVDAC